MKRILILAVLILALALTACGNQAAPVEMPAPTATIRPVPTATPEPEGNAASVLVDGLGTVYTTFKDGTELKLTGEQGDYYLVDYEGATLLVEKRLVRLAGADFEPWDGYAKSDAPVYGSAYLTGEALKKLPLNTKLTVLAELGNVLKAELEDGEVVYIPKDMVNDYLTQYYDYGSGSGGGSASAPADGGDIVLASAKLRPADKPRLVMLTAESPVYPTTGTILADGVEGYLSLLRRGDAVKVIGKEGDMAVLLIDGHRCTVPAALVRLESEKKFDTRDGYAAGGALIYTSWDMTTGEALTLNTPVKLLEDLGDCWYVQWEGGFGYMPKTAVGDTPAVGGYDYGGGDSGGGGGAQWTEPTM